MIRNSRFLVLVLVGAVAWSLALSSAIFAQTISLSPEQQRLLNQLPASQRDAAMRQLRSMSQQVSAIQQRETGPEQPVTPIDESNVESEFEPLPPVIFKADATALVTATIPESVNGETAADQEHRSMLVSKLHKQNPYTLDKDGRLILPGINPIYLAGLNEQQASMRVSSDPALLGIDVQVALLPLSNVGLDALQPFGYDLFEKRGSSSNESYGAPVPADYVIGPGDSLRIQLFGNRNAEYELQVERDGSIRFPEIGPLHVGGMTFEQLRQLVNSRVNEQLIGTQSNVSMGELRLVQVFLVGDVNSPGSYTVGSLSTMTTVLSVGGGVAKNGSLRRVQLKRNDKVVSTLDVYDLLLRGDTSGDARVQSGDVVFVPPVGTRVTVSGEVKRPGIYEYRGAANVADIVRLAGGLLPTALASEIRIERLDPALGLQAIDAGTDSPETASVKVSDGDVLRVPAGSSDYDMSIRLVGNVQRPGAYQWRTGMRIADLIPSGRYLNPNSDVHYALIRREDQPNSGIRTLSADLAAAWAMRGSVVDIELKPRDTIYVFDLLAGRNQYIDPLIDELRLRSSFSQPLAIVNVGGSVNATGAFPLESEMRVSDLVRAGGGLADSAYPGEAELTRYTVGPDGRRDTRVIAVDLRQALSGNDSADLVLQPFDYLNIRETPDWRDVEYVEIRGEVEFPGRYPIRKNETIASVVARAGGLSDTAFPSGSIFTRESLKERERNQLEVLAKRMESDLASMSLADPGQSEALGIGETLLTQLRSAEPIGRMVVDLEGLLNDAKAEPLIMRDGDTLYIPPIQQDVTVLVEVQYSTSHHYIAKATRDDYIRMSGGTSNNADSARIYVVRASGEVVVGNRSRFFARSKGVSIEPGDTIVVPLDTDRIRPLTLWTSVSQILYNVAIAATAVSRF